MSKSAHKTAYDSMLRRCKRAIESKCGDAIYKILYGDEADTTRSYKLEDFPSLHDKYHPQLMAILDEMMPTGPEPAIKVEVVTDTEPETEKSTPKSPNGNPFDNLYKRQRSGC